MTVHIPVLLNEMLAAVAPRAGETIIDGTFGAGGYTTAILDAAPCRVIAFDRDPAAIARADALKAKYGERFEIVKSPFSEMAERLSERGIDAVDGIVLDLGVSSPQLDEPERGFSFRADGPLDMRMGDIGPTAADLVNTMDEAELADIIHELGEERHARRVARAIVAARAEAPIETTGRLAEIVRRVVRKSADGIDPATRSFMALRLAVNDELGEVRRTLLSAETMLRTGGRLVVVTFHSLEDRLVKQFIARRSGATGGSRHLPMQQVQAPSFTAIGKSLTAGTAELSANPRARSGRLRAAVRTAAPALAPLPEEIAA